MVDSSFFNLDNMVAATGTDPFADSTKKYDTDDRFYKLTRNDDDVGVAVIRFLPDAERGLFQQVYRIGTEIEHNGKRRFVNELSPQTIGKPCPFQEEWARLWNIGDKDGAKKFSRTLRYYTNIKVIKDPANPANEGKIFLLDVSRTLKDKIQSIMQPNEQDIALGATAKELFNPLKGYSFKLACKRGSNGFITYDPSDAMPNEDGIYSSVEEALADIKENTHKLSQFLDASSYLSYEELKDKFDWVTGKSAQGSETVSVKDLGSQAEQVQNVEVKAAIPEVQAAQTAQVQEVQQVQQAQEQTKESSLDDLLAGLV